jgi:hypothetical protein
MYSHSVYENSVLLSILEKITNSKKKELAFYRLIQKSSDSPKFVIFMRNLLFTKKNDLEL